MSNLISARHPIRQDNRRIPAGLKNSEYEAIMLLLLKDLPEAISTRREMNLFPQDVKVSSPQSPAPSGKTFIFKEAQKPTESSRVARYTSETMSRRRKRRQRAS